MHNNHNANLELIDGLLITGFTVSEVSFGIDAQLVLEVVKVGEVTPVHGAPVGVSGIRNLRGRIVTVVDMAAHLEMGSIVLQPESRLLIMDHQGETFGFLVEAVTDAFVLDAKFMTTPPSSLAPALRSRVSGVYREGDHLTAILDAGALFRWKDEAE